MNQKTLDFRTASGTVQTNIELIKINDSSSTFDDFIDTKEQEIDEFEEELQSKESCLKNFENMQSFGASKMKSFKDSISSLNTINLNGKTTFINSISSPISNYSKQPLN
jgi:hypothetical protein